MSKALTPVSQSHALQLDFCQPGAFSRPTGNHLHRKSTPFAILLSAPIGGYIVRNELGEVMIGGEQVALIPAHTTTDFIHRDGPDGFMSARWIHFRYSLYGLVDFLSLFETPLLLPENVSSALFRTIEQMNRQPNPSPVNLARHHILAAQALDGILSVSKRNDKAWRQIEKSRLRPVLHYIRENLGQPLTVDQLARFASLSPSRFHAQFNADFGCSPMRYVKQQRLEKAARLLAGANSKLAEIADLTGFADAFHLSHAFKSRYGVAPRVYRLQAQNWNDSA